MPFRLVRVLLVRQVEGVGAEHSVSDLVLVGMRCLAALAVAVRVVGTVLRPGADVAVRGAPN